MLRVRSRLSTTLFRQLSTETAHEAQAPKVVIPPAIKRGPTDMLRALSETVGVDPTAPHFAFIDDPAMIPTTAANKRTYYMAKEMGKRAARQLAEEWPTLFALDRDDPYLPAFRPQKPADPLQVAPTEENVLSMIEKREVEDAVRLYERIRADDIDVSQEVQTELFKLVTYYNGKNVPFSEWEEWHGMRAFGENEPNKWTPAGLADLLFEVLPHSPEIVSIYIAGLIKFATPESIEKAKELHEGFSSTGILRREAYDALISVANWKDAKGLFKEMSVKKVKPDTSTWNALLSSASQLNVLPERLSAFENVIGEMLAVGVQPSLETYRNVVNSIAESVPRTDSKDAEKKTNTILSVGISWLSEMLSDMEARSTLELRSTKDHLFFLDAMGMAYQAANMDIAERLVRLYENPANNVKLPALPTEGIFYTRYLLLFIEKTSSMEEIEKKYKELVPRLVGVSRQLTLAVAEKLKHSPRWTLLRRLIEDGICARQMVDFRVAPTFRNLLIDLHYQALSVQHREEYTNLVRRMVDIWVEFSRFTDEKQKRLQFKLSPTNISECALLLTRVGDSERAYELLGMLLDPDASEGEEATVLNTGYVKHSAMMQLFEDALREKDPYKAATCLEIMSSSLPRNKLEPLVQRIHDSCKLTADQSRILTGFVRLRPQ
ncbi:Protein PTCD3 mitochondrial [Trichostrongylus colubriformis]|uniref:Protein PTCD3 mitochondrial n=1 Tax=Trichostrongylus colubriformis TaxID=6319 RepID=A0AAN8IWY2_TRICO